MKTLLNLVYGILIGLLTGGVIWLAASRPRGEPETLLPPPLPRVLTVYVSGAVATPGVYTLADGSRVNDAVRVAGGFVSGAEQERINLAALLKDGQQIDVPGIVNTSHVNAGRVDINTATVSELDALPGIGLTTAQTIVDYRIQNGPFQIIQDIQYVPGIGIATYDRIKDYITVEP
jgi:competence protein ComEA